MVESAAKCRQCNRLLRDGECPSGCTAMARARQEARESKKRARARLSEARREDYGAMQSFSRQLSQRLVEQSPLEAASHARHVKRARTGWRGRS